MKKNPDDKNLPWLSKHKESFNKKQIPITGIITKGQPTFKKLHTSEEGEAHLKMFVWHLLMNLKNNYLLKTVEVGE